MRFRRPDKLCPVHWMPLHVPLRSRASIVRVSCVELRLDTTNTASKSDDGRSPDTVTVAGPPLALDVVLDVAPRLSCATATSVYDA